ncbi:nuclear body protein SP140-like protein [Danio aesculapii]|uniref:nuclear body protein SP140-like protein n=1 Tax=Danio aesculapii TaxID=1142201 RepID=UPI0024BF29F6|nr:nuclear body protein SP140-like protein [Danio aesculapii]
MQNYPTLRLLKDNLPVADINCPERPLDAETLTKKSEGAANKKKEKKTARKKNRDAIGSKDSGGPGPSSASNVTQKKPAKQPSFSSPVKDDDHQEIWMFPKYKTELPVKCGKTEGTLHRDKLAKGKKCFFAQGCWFSPGEFEKFAGKEKSKNWKVSIRCDGTPLKKLIEENHLQCKPMQRKQGTSVRKSKKVQIVISSSEDSSPDLRPDFSGGGSQFRSRLGDDDEEEEEDEMGDLTVFQAPTLPVACVSLSGTLYKNRFATGKRGKSIRTEERWFTPEEFVKEEPTLTNGLWKKDILCHGKTLNFLCKKKILQIHSLLCECVECSTDPEDLADQNNDDVCFACHTGGDLVCCDECPRAFHTYCHLPPVLENASGEWICTFCGIKKKRKLQGFSNTTEQDV